MSKIEIIGRLKSKVKIEGKTYHCNDVNLDKDFLIDFTKNLLMKLGQINDTIQYEKFFDEEIISKVKVAITADQINFKLLLSRDTFGNQVLIGCEVKVDGNAIDDKMFGTIYSVKIQLIEMFNKFCENSNVFLLQDFNNEQICQNAYIEIHKVENRLRSILTRYLMKKYGKLLLSKSLKKEVDEYSKWFRSEVNGKYKTFKRINTDYSNIDFVKLLKILEIKEYHVINGNEDSIASKLSQLKALVDNDASVSELLEEIRLIEESVNNREYVFSGKPSKEDEEEAIKLFGSSDVLNHRDMLTILDDEFKDYWGKLSKMRNMIAHNKPICKELYEDTITICNWIHEKFNECDTYIESSFYSDEEGVRGALEDMEVEKERYESDYIEQQREALGIGFPLSESYVEEALAESCTEIQNLISAVKGLGNIESLLHEIESCLYEIDKIGNNEEHSYLNSEIRRIIIKELKLDIDPNDNRLDLDLFVERCLFRGINIQDAIQYYTENKNYLDANFDYFDLNFKVGWYDINNTIHSITVDGEIYPENGRIDEIQFSLYTNDEKHKTYDVQINYGDYRDPSDGNIDDSQIGILINEIEGNVKDTIKFFTKVHNVTEQIMKLF